MKQIILAITLLIGNQVFAQAYPEIRLMPGQSQVFYDYNSQQSVQVTCMPSQPMPQPMPPPVCSLKFGLPATHCGDAYQVLIGNNAATACTTNLDFAISEMKNLIAARNCTEPRPVGCDIKLNNPGGHCGGYQVYAYLEPISICLAGLQQAQQILNTLRVNGICM